MPGIREEKDIVRHEMKCPPHFSIVYFCHSGRTSSYITFHPLYGNSREKNTMSSSTHREQRGIFKEEDESSDCAMLVVQLSLCSWMVAVP
jgi:hypothetical protein